MSSSGWPVSRQQIDLTWTYCSDENLIVHEYQEGATDEDDEDEDEKVTATDKADGDERDDDDDDPPTCQHCDNYVSHFYPENGIAGSFDKASLDLQCWVHENPFNDFLGLEKLKAELSAKSSEAERLRTQLNVTRTTLDAKHKQIMAVLEENCRLKASRQNEDLQRDRLREDLKDQQKRYKVLTDRIAQVEERRGRCRQALVDSRQKRESALRELENTRRELENAQQHLAQISPPPPRPIEDASTSSAVAMSPGPSQDRVWIILSP